MDGATPRLHLLTLLLLVAGPAGGTGARATNPIDGSGEAAPAAGLRPLTTDRPDVTESPITVDAGHVQVELDFVNFARDREDGGRREEWGVLPFNLRFGLGRDIEAGLFVAPYVRRSATPRAGVASTMAGFGDMTLRVKANSWGNDGGASAGGLIVDLGVPTAARGLGAGHLEGTVTLPVQFELPGGWDLGAMTAVRLRPGAAPGSRLVWVNSATLGHDLTRSLSGYAELTSAAGDGPHVATADVGLAWKLDANTQLDLGTNLGLSRAADDLLVFTGFSRRY